MTKTSKNEIRDTKSAFKKKKIVFIQLVFQWINSNDKGIEVFKYMIISMGGCRMDVNKNKILKEVAELILCMKIKHTYISDKGFDEI